MIALNAKIIYYLLEEIKMELAIVNYNLIFNLIK